MIFFLEVFCSSFRFYTIVFWLFSTAVRPLKLLSFDFKYACCLLSLSVKSFESRIPDTSPTLLSDYQTWNWVIGSPGQWVISVIFYVRVTGSSFWPGVRPELFRFSKKCPKCETYIWNAEITKVIVRCLLLDWNHWMSVHAMNFYFCLWLLKIFWLKNTSSHVSRHLESL